MAGGNAWQKITHSAISLNQLSIFCSSMTSASFLKSKAFKEREENAREKVRQASKQDLLADISRYMLCKFNFFLDYFMLKLKAKLILYRHYLKYSLQTLSGEKHSVLQCIFLVNLTD